MSGDIFKWSSKITLEKEKTHFCVVLQLEDKGDKLMMGNVMAEKNSNN